MKKSKKLLCLFSTVILSISAFTGALTASGYYDISKVYKNLGYYHDEPKIQIGNISYIFKKDVEYDNVKIPYSATVVNIPNVQKVEIPKQVTYDGIEFTVTDLDLYGDYQLTKNNKDTVENKFTNVEEIILPETIYNITEFGYFPNLKKMNIPRNTVIGRYSLENLIYEYKDEHLDNSEYNAYFRGCPNLKLSLDKNNSYYSYKNDMLLSKDGKTLYMSFNSNSDLVIPDGVVYMCDDGGYGFENVRNIKLPDTLKSICEIYFPKLTKIKFPNSYKEVGYKDLYNSGVKSIEFSKKATFISGRAFMKCKNLESVTLPKKLRWICESAFKDCKELKSVKILSKNLLIEYQAFSKCGNLKTVTLNGVRSIDMGAFYKCKKLSKVKIGNKKKAPEIEKNAFKGTKKGIKFCVKNKKVAKSLKKQLKGSGVKNARIIVKNKVIYKNVK